MEITNTYRNNIKEIEKFLTSFSFSEESEQRIRKYINNPVDCVNDKIKGLFEKYKDYIVDYRIPLPDNMLKTVSEQPAEVIILCRFLTNMLTSFESDKLDSIKISNETVSQNYFIVGKDRKKVWKYINSHIADMAKEIIGSKNSDDEIHMDRSEHEHFRIYQMIENFVRSLGTRNTSIKSKFTKWKANSRIVKADIESVTNSLSALFNMAQEVVSAKIIDQNKFKLYLSFNVFDWLLASSGESFHSCIDMDSSMCYGLGMLGMCGCPDWGMLIYTDGTNKTYMGIETLHIVTRSWTCNLKNGSFRVVGWYPKDIRGSVNLESIKDSDFSFNFGADGEKSYSSWEPITFNNGAVAWIYSDLNHFKIDDTDRKKVYFAMEGAAGMPGFSVNKKGIVTANSRPFNKCLSELKARAGSIGGFVGKRLILKDYIGGIMAHCDHCGKDLTEDELIYVESENTYVCKDCFERFYFFDEWSNTHCSVENGVELYFSPMEYDYILTTRNRVENDPDVFYDEISKRYFMKSSMKMIIINDKMSSEYTLGRYKELGYYRIESIGENVYKIA